MFLQPSAKPIHPHRKASWGLIAAILAVGMDANTATAQTDRQKQALKRCGVGLVLPGWLPPGYRMARFRLDKECPESAKGAIGEHPGYVATYTGPNQCEFRIGGSNGGWGAPPPVRQWQVKTKLFGTVVLEEYEADHPGREMNHLSADATNPPYLKSFPQTGFDYWFSCKNRLFSVKDAQRIIQSSVVIR